MVFSFMFRVRIHSKVCFNIYVVLYINVPWRKPGIKQKVVQMAPSLGGYLMQTDTGSTNKEGLFTRNPLS